MGKVGMNSRLLLFVIAGLIVSPYHVNNVFAEPGDLLYTIEDSGLKKDMFRSSMDTVGNKIVVGASGKIIDGIDYAGGLYVFDDNTGSLLFTIDNPDPDRGDDFGKHMITTDNNIVVGLHIESPNDVQNKGMMYVFEGDTGSLLYTIDNPNGKVDDGWFGNRIGSMGDNVISGSHFKNSEGKWEYEVHVFDGNTGSLLYTLNDFISDDSSGFGYSSVFFNESIAVYAPDEDPNDDIHTNTIQVFDAKIGSFQYVIENPDPSIGHFGKHLAEVNDNLVVGVPTYEYDDSLSGFIYVFDGQTGSLLFTIEYPEEKNTDAEFGGYLSAVGDNIALRSTSDQTDHDNFLPISDVFYVFDGQTGSLLLTLDEPELKDQNSGLYISSVNSNGNLAISGMNTVEKYSEHRPVYVFEGIPNTAIMIDKPSNDDAPFFGIFVYLDELFSWIVGK